MNTSKMKGVAILLVFAVCIVVVPVISQAAEAKYKIKLGSHHPDRHAAIQTLKNSLFLGHSSGKLLLAVFCAKVFANK